MSRDPSPLDFFAKLRWLDGMPLLSLMEPYRRALFMRALYTFDDAGRPLTNFVLAGRGKKNWKTADMILAAFYKMLIPDSVQGNDVLIVASDEDQAGDALDLAKKLIACNPVLDGLVTVLAKQIVRKDGKGAMKIIARDASGAHGKTACMVAFDELHTHRNWDLLEALQPDPTRPDALVWVTSYDVIVGHKGIPIFDLKKIGMSGEDPKMLFSWYSGEYCTDPDFAELPPEERANPSMGSWPEGMDYLEQQKRRLPTFQYRRLHLNLPGAPTGAVFDPDKVIEAVIDGRKKLPFERGIKYVGFVDMSGGSSDDATMAIAHKIDDKVIVDLVEKQKGGTPFNPRDAVRKFAGIMTDYGLRSVEGDRYAGTTFRHDFEEAGISYRVASYSKSELYEQLEPMLNAGEVELPDVPKLREQLLGLVLKGNKIDHLASEHDDFANAVAGAVVLAAKPTATTRMGTYGMTAPLPTRRRERAMVRNENGDLVLRKVAEAEEPEVHSVVGLY